MNNLINLAKANDNKAMELLIDKYKGLIYKAAYQPHLAMIRQEAISEAYLSFYQAVQTFDEHLEVPFAGYAKMRVYAGVHNLFRRYLRIWQHELLACNKVSCDDDADFLASFGDDIDILDNLMHKIDLLKIVQKLPQRQKLVFTKIVIEGFSMTQTAEYLHISPQAVSKNYGKAMRTLKLYLEG